MPDANRLISEPVGRDYIEANFVHRCYISMEDIRVCRGFDVGSLSANDRCDLIEALHETLLGSYACTADCQLAGSAGLLYAR